MQLVNLGNTTILANHAQISPQTMLIVRELYGPRLDAHLLELDPYP